MKFGVTKLSSAVRLALSLGAVIAVGASSTAFAQDTSAQDTTTQPSAKKAQTLQTVVVTGSLIRRVDLETSNPVVTIDRAQIQATGKMTLGDLVQQLPSMTGGNVNPEVNNAGGTGTSSINLRGLGSNRTLILVNGQRLLGKDPNMIPADAIERIDVLPTGASATYGSDAIGGVVNFILRKDYQGAQFTANVGESDRNDGDQSGYSFTFGQTSDKGSIMAGINYSKQDSIIASARPFSINAVSISTSGPYIGGSSSTPSGRVQLPGTVANPAKGIVASGLAGSFGCPTVTLSPGGNSQVVSSSNYHCYSNNSDAYNYAGVNLDLTPQQHTGGFVNGEFKLGDHVSAYMDAIYQKTSSNFQLAPAVYGTDTTGAAIAADNAFNPFVDSNGKRVAFNASTGNQFRGRLLAAGPRNAAFGRTNAQINTGLKGDFTVADQTWNWDAGLNYGHMSSVTTSGGLADQTALYTGASTMNPDGTATCPAGISTVACQFNPFDLNSPGSKAAIAAALVNAPNNLYQIEKTYHAGLSGGLFNLPAGTVQLALGAEYHTIYEHATPAPQLQIDPSTGTCILGSQCTSAVQGGYSTKSIYGEAFIPVLSNMPGVQSLNVTIGDRYSRVPDFGNNNSFKFAVEWKPIDDLLLRGTMEQVFRTPTLAELFTGSSDAPNIHSDPCDGYTGAPAGSGLALACQNVLTDGSFRDNFVASNTQASTVVQGAKVAGFPIKPEAGKTYDFGMVYSPSYVPGLSTTIDLWRVNLNNTITDVGLQSLLNLCAAGSTEYCKYIQRNGASGPNQGQILQSTVEPFGNLGSLNTSGVDWSLNYKLPQFGFGQFNVGINSTYLKYYNQVTAPGVAGSVTYHDAGHFLPFGSAQASACPDNAGVCLFPRWRGQGFVNWQMGGWSAEWRMRYIGRFQNGGPAYTLQDTTPDFQHGTVFKYGATVYNDVSMGYNIEPINTRVDFGVNNLFDKQPPILYSNNVLNANTDPSNFDLIGRYYWARVTVKF